MCQYGVPYVTLTYGRITHKQSCAKREWFSRPYRGAAVLAGLRTAIRALPSGAFSDYEDGSSDEGPPMISRVHFSEVIDQRSDAIIKGRSPGRKPQEYAAQFLRDVWEKLAQVGYAVFEKKE